MPRRYRGSAVALVAILAAALLTTALPLPGRTPAAADFIVQADSADVAASAVLAAGGRVTSALPIIDAVAATLPAGAAGRLGRQPGVRLFADRDVRSATADDPIEPTSAGGSVGSPLLYPAAATGAMDLHGVMSSRGFACRGQEVRPLATPEARPLQGWGVTVAVIDSGFMEFQNQNEWTRDPLTGALYAENADEGRCIVYRDFLPSSRENGNFGPAARNSVDQNGHGTHVASTIADGRRATLVGGLPPAPVGVAPKVNLVVARALAGDGSGSYANVIAAIQWVLENRTRYNIRVLNLSIYSPVAGPYWSDPLNQAVMRAWQAGIVVVVAAGNAGPEPGTITSPGNIPYVVTVGAVRSARYNVSGADELALYSSRGPTESAFVKPDVLVPASRTIAPMPDDAVAARAIPEARIQERSDVDFGIGRPSKRHTYYQLSGTSMAAAQVSGIVALMLQASPSMTNEQVKHRLMATARAALDERGRPLYSLWEQGAGLVDARQAVLCDAPPADLGLNLCAAQVANAGMDIAQDLTTDTHYWGYTEWDETTGEFVLVDASGQAITWSGAGRLWAGAGRLWAGAGRLWAGAGRLWAGAGRLWAGNWVEQWARQDSTWAGAGRLWAGSYPVSNIAAASSGTRLVLSEPPLYEVALPLVRQ